MGERNRCSVTWTLAVTVSLASLKLSAGLVTCDFRDDFCGWTPTAVGGIWERYFGSSVNGIRPPSGVPSFAYILSGQESYAHLESQEINLHTASVIRFRVVQMRSEFSSSNNMAELVMIPSDGSEQKILWNLRNTQSQFGWTNPYVEVPLRPDMGSFKLRLRFKVGSLGSTSAVASIILLNDAVSLTCTFASTFCGWFPETTDEIYQWRLTKLVVAAPNNITGVAGSENEGFLWAQGNFTDEERESRLVSRSVTLSSPATLRFWTYATAAMGSTISVNLLLPSGEERVVEFDAVKRGEWVQKTVTISETGTYSIVIAANVTRIRRFGLDEIVFLTTEDPVYGEGPLTALTTLPTTTETTIVPTTRRADFKMRLNFSIEIALTFI